MKLGINIRVILIILGFVSAAIGCTMLAGLVVSFIYSESDMTRVFLLLMVVFTLGGIGIIFFSRRGHQARTIKIREGIISVTLCWVFASLLCAVPYMLAGSHLSFIDAFFEATACITTTGSTLMENLAELPKSLLFWRMLTNWLGGLGIIIFAITIIPMLGFGAANLASAEMPTQSFEKIQSRVKDTVRYIFLLFIALTGVETVLLCAGGTGVYDAFILSFGCMGNGGFGNYQSESSPYQQVIITVFCLIASMSFVSYQLLLKRRIRDFLRDTEIRLFLLMVAVVCLLIFVILVASGTYSSAEDAARYGIFQTVSFVTTSGYAGVNFDLWPQATHWLLFMVMIVGGCSGSASSGIKVVRAAVVFSLIRRNIYKRLHPNAVVAVKLGDKVVPSDRVSSIAVFVILYALISLFSCFVLSFENLDAETTFGTVLAMLSNTGLVLGPGIAFDGSMAVFSQFSRLYMSILMIAGRLELFTILLIFTPAFWRPYR